MIRAYLQVFLVVLVSIFTCSLPAFAVETQLLKARVVDIEGSPMATAKLFIYDSSSVRRPADFISPLSNSAGQIQIALPPGKYWVVARFKSDGKYGPLMPDDKHSGEPLEVDMITSGTEADFVVADIKELGQKKRVGATDSLRLKGCVIDGQGTPVAHTYVYANSLKEFSETPEFVSAWTGDDGRYELFIPPGPGYFVSVSRQFPPVISELKRKPLLIESGKIDIAIDINLTVE